MNIFEENKKVLDKLIAKGEKIPKYLKLALAKHSNEWVVENYPEWVIEWGKLPKEFRRRT